MPENSDENQLKDCYYAGWFSAAEKRLLRKSSPDGSDEITNLRCFAGRLTRHLAQKQPGEYGDDDLKLLNTLVKISVGIGALQRGSPGRQGRSSAVEKSIQDAIENLEADWSLA
jgi:hypothetical protein